VTFDVFLLIILAVINAQNVRQAYKTDVFSDSTAVIWSVYNYISHSDLGKNVQFV